MFLAQCEHRAWLLVDDDAVSCEKCGDWVYGKEVGYITVELREDGSIVAEGSRSDEGEEL